MEGGGRALELLIYYAVFVEIKWAVIVVVGGQGLVVARRKGLM